MTTVEELLPIEKSLWTGGPNAYREHVDEACLLAFTKMARVSSRDEVVATVAHGPRWRELEIDVQGLIQPASDVAIFTYRASAVRGDDERYRALVGSGYVRRDDGWKLIYHQQTPLGEAEDE